MQLVCKTNSQFLMEGVRVWKISARINKIQKVVVPKLFYEYSWMRGMSFQCFNASYIISVMIHPF